MTPEERKKYEAAKKKLRERNRRQAKEARRKPKQPKK